MGNPDKIISSRELYNKLVNGAGRHVSEFEIADRLDLPTNAEGNIDLPDGFYRLSWSEAIKSPSIDLDMFAPVHYATLAEALRDVGGEIGREVYELVHQVLDRRSQMDVVIWDDGKVTLAQSGLYGRDTCPALVMRCPTLEQFVPDGDLPDEDDFVEMCMECFGEVQLEDVFA